MYNNDTKTRLFFSCVKPTSGAFGPYEVDLFSMTLPVVSSCELTRKYHKWSPLPNLD